MDGLGSADILLFEGFRLDRRGGVLYRSAQGAVGVPVELGPRTIALLGLLAARQGDVVSKDAIMKAVWPGRAVEDANLNMQISKLRQMLDQNRGEGSCIQTLRGRGYCFVAPVTRLGADAPPALPTISEVDVRPRQRLSIVVLPFDNLSRDPGQQYFADGITEDLTTALSRFTDMLVISRNTAFTYRDRPRETRQIGRELGVCYVLEGSVRRSSRRVRVNAQLIDAEADESTCSPLFRKNDPDPAYTIVWNARMLEAFKTLSKEQQHALMLFYFQGLTFQEIADQQGYSYGNAKHHVYRGLHRLRSIVFDRVGQKPNSGTATEMKCEPWEMAE